MKPLLTITFVIVAHTVCAFAQPKESCASFDALVKATYNFKPSRLSEAERDAKSIAMDKVWNMAIGKPRELLPCLRANLENANADPWFLFDGSNLLVKLDPSPESKAIQVRNYTNVDLADVNLQIWVETLARLGTQGFDVSEAGNRWLTYPDATYFLPRHGAYQVKTFEGALFIYGSMEESQSLQALLKIVNQPNHPGREHGLWILMSQATPESLRSLKQINTAGLSQKARSNLSKLLNNPELITPRANPKTTREEFLQAFQEFVEGKWEKFFELVSKVPDGEKDVVATLKTEDLPLVRKIRRHYIANASPHAIEFYHSFTSILMTMIWKAGLVHRDSKAIASQITRATSRESAKHSAPFDISNKFLFTAR